MITVINRRCPKCGKVFSEIPARSRSDENMLICPDCAIREALDIFGCDDREKDDIIAIVHKYYDRRMEE